ncbi:hypothetical protein B0T25DRAFT_524686 [Lasiosphaeria hispida]|uniref:Uncharacterized protein n=1 Tax=Lasiosphaeria hispida TaxID=260671 RepID=A0AAJ0HTH4_9PEZI|nr:hypothetical protein B0T25DRAFT_524686 [Lasiosphaeria hispida]
MRYENRLHNIAAKPNLQCPTLFVLSSPKQRHNPAIMSSTFLHSLREYILQSSHINSAIVFAVIATMLASVAWLADSISPSNTGRSSETAASTHQDSADTYEPSVLDVLIVKAMLNKSLLLPPEIVDNIVDQAEYWPHTTAEFTSNGDYSIRGGSHGSENELLLRSVPLGFPRWPPRERTESHHPPVLPKPVGDEFPADTFQELIASPVPTLAHPCRKIVFTIKSRDQGWGGERQHHGTYNGSWTWFEAGLERWSRSENYNEAEPDPSSVARPSLNPADLSPVYPIVEFDSDSNQNSLRHTTLPSEEHKIQCNVTALRELKEHRVVWCYTNEDDETNEAAAVALAEKGRGRATGDGKFVRDLRLGDVVTVWGMARFPAWVNYVRSVKIDVYWAV